MTKRMLISVLVLALVIAPALTDRSAGVPRTSGSVRAPLIGITCTIRGDQGEFGLHYARAVREAGGLPVIVPILDDADDALRAQYVSRLDGLVLIGGIRWIAQVAGKLVYDLP